MDEGADVSGERRAVADDLPWNGGLCGDARFVDHECAEGGENEDEGHEDLGGVPREADTTESQASHGHRGTGDDEDDRRTIRAVPSDDDSAVSKPRSKAVPNGIANGHSSAPGQASVAEKVVDGLPTAGLVDSLS